MGKEKPAKTLQQRPQQMQSQKTPQPPQILQPKTRQIPRRFPQQPQPMPVLPSYLSTSGPVDDEDDFLAVDSESEVDLESEPALCKEQQDLLDLIIPEGMSSLLAQQDAASWITDAMKLPVSKLKSDAKFRPIIKKGLEETGVLIIDEIGMVENHHFQPMNECLKSARCWSFQHNDYNPNALAFGGIQLLVIGDFCQLPPVKPFENCMYCDSRTIANAKRNPTEWNCDSHRPCGPFYVEDQWAFKNDAWEEANFTQVHLKEIHRQSDQSFVKMLQKCRLGLPFSKAEEKMLLRQNPDDPKFQNVTKLFCLQEIRTARE
ncbi:hypothetical protein J7337_012343 [Fusarium musae]|uniref:ATP-dependent DNA helicase n=1 Tax=Fusarium musae TaxID=1042133 RepID=A0A9P8IJ95_9HYPO|nr:hypothetical protein J7337_012343 [Fusarium musae]KAG9495785.1 hypothetical protein J7337_012343 [Fusarium musae]